MCLVAMREPQLNETVPCCAASHCSVSKETITRNVQKEPKVVQRAGSPQLLALRKLRRSRVRNRNFSSLDERLSWQDVSRIV